MEENNDMDKFEDIWDVRKTACDPSTLLSAESNSDIA